MGIDARVYVSTRKKLTDNDVLRLAYEAGLSFGSDKFFRSDGWSYTEESGKKVEVPGHHNISRVDKIEQDGPDVLPKKGETLLEVHVFTRYYGPDYERGDLPFLVVLAEWLERKIPGCTVLYGGDSSGVCAAPFGAVQRKALLDHFAGESGRGYFTQRSQFDPPDMPEPTCPLCKVVMTRYSWGPGPKCGKWLCNGCGHREKTSDGGTTFTKMTDEEIRRDG